ncbi:MAG: sulfatase-like hydrolase/transferase [Litorimonas sp.]
MPLGFRFFIGWFVLCAWMYAVQDSTANEGPTQPNIIVIMSDDQAQWTLGAYKKTMVETPHLDRLAKEGVLFANAMSSAPVCSPSRASLYTGKIPSAHGVHDFLSESPKFNADWLAGQTLLSERMKAVGYQTAMIGKWHATTDSREPQRGYDHWLSYDTQTAGWQNQYEHSGTVHFSRNGEPKTYKGVQAEFLTDEAVSFIDHARTKDKARPFFINLNYVEPHSPFSGLPERLVKKYRGKADSLIRAGGTSDMIEMGENNLVPDDHGEKLAQYLAAVSLLDEQVGDLIGALKRRKLLKNTLIVYVSDHGLLMGRYGVYGKTNATAQPNFYEETIRVPLIVSGPENLVRNRQTREEFVDLLDLHATLLDFAGETMNLRGPGRSFSPLLKGLRTTDWRPYQYAERGPSRMITDGHWKLVRTYSYDTAIPPKDRWYDLSHPMGEIRSTEPPRPALQQKLSRALNDYFAMYETKEFSGRRIWDQPAPNGRVKSEIARDKNSLKP